MDQEDKRPWIIYCDWNVFDKLEKAERLAEDERNVYLEIRQKAIDQEIIVPYSNAHINDLSRGFVKNPDYTAGHLQNITAITQNLCIAQYWGEHQTRWHFRDPEEFLNATLEENNNTAPDFSSLYASLDEPLLSAAFDLRKTLLKMQPMPEAFRQIYQVDPVFNIMYPRTKVEMNLLAFCEDLYAFSRKIKTDFALYNQHKKMLVNLKNRFPTLIKSVQNADNEIIGKPEYLQWDKAWDDLGAKFKVYKNPQADKVIGLFTTMDLKGYRQDERFANMIDDALHCFYAAHCDYFLTLDKRCADKAILVYNKLKIATKVIEPSGLIQELNNR
jgi:hypothetical protein